MGKTYILRKDSPEAVKHFTETITYDQFTDGTGTSGAYVITEGNFPIGANVIAVSLREIEGFTGDTSAVITVGDGSDADRYNTGTPSVFATATGGIALGDPSGVKYHAAAKNITITVTSAADWGDVDGGKLVLHFYYLLAE